MPIPTEINLQVGEKVAEKAHSDGAASSPSPPDSPPANDEGQQNKLFVGGLCWNTTEETLRSFFESYGEIVDCTIMKDQYSRRSRGFGFVTFRDGDSVQDVLDAHAKEAIIIDEKEIDPKVAVPPKRNKVRRIFVGGLSSDTTEADMRHYFLQFGNVEEVQLMYDRNTNRHRGFGFVTFEKPYPAEKVCSIQYHDIKGKKVEVKVAQTKEALAMQSKAKVIAQSYAGFNYSPSYPSFYPQYPMDMLYNPHHHQIVMGAKPNRGKMRGMNNFVPPAYAYGAYGFPDQRLGSGPFYPSGYSGMPGPYYMRGMPPDPALAMGSAASMEYISDQFQGMAINGSYVGNPYLSPTHGSPPSNGYLPIPSSSANYSETLGSSYSPPSGISPTAASATNNSTNPPNGFSQVTATFTGSANTYNSLQQTSA